MPPCCRLLAGPRCGGAALAAGGRGGFGLAVLAACVCLSNLGHIQQMLHEFQVLWLEDSNAPSGYSRFQSVMVPLHHIALGASLLSAASWASLWGAALAAVGWGGFCAGCASCL